MPAHGCCARCVRCGTTAPMPFTGCGLCGAKEFTTVEQVEGMDSLVSNLNGTVDCLRDLFTQLGARQYEVSLVWTRWTGGERGLGDESVVRALALLPTPLVADLDSTLRRDLQSIGMNEAGSLRVSELSPNLNEDLLMGRGIVVPLGTAVPEDMDFYWEVFFPQTGVGGVRRRFIPKSPPNKNPTMFQWTIDLLKVSEDRGRDGLPA